MLRYVWIQMGRKPVVALAVILFAAIMTLSLVGLYSGMDATAAEYEQICSQIEVRCAVTNLAGNQSDRLGIYPGTVSLFTDPAASTLAELLEDVQIKGSTTVTWNEKDYTLVGITSAQADARLLPENGCTIFWNGGADESIFGGKSMVCLIPLELQKELVKAELPGSSFLFHISAAYQQETAYDGELTVGGTYAGGNDTVIYCPWEAYTAILESMGRTAKADSLSALLLDNQNLQLLRETASEYFAEPNPNMAGLESVGDYIYALDINDSKLAQAKVDFNNSMAVNRAAVGVVLVLSAGAGFLIGFLMVRSRKREIALMRTMGTPDSSIYFGFVLEQMLCVVVGIALGGAYNRWEPIERLGILAAIYFVGLTAALVIFLRKNLLTTIKEDE